MASVSVVITAFNQGELIAEAVASAWAQTSTPAQVIVVDDGSNDPSSLDVLRSLDADVISQPNSGVSVARNTGFGAATADLVVVLDGDDRLAPSFIEGTASLLDSNPAMVAASSLDAPAWGRRCRGKTGRRRRSRLPRAQRVSRDGAGAPDGLATMRRIRRGHALGV
ncbi:glycosyltransferase family 2 protein [Demequina litorisediminis]|uniref:Glycosyltransferase 2-like domain-containing protein n=1 Tax=Demequina litorisediminis TaxID=1849022 RepID=A0ABQ6IBW2_9MICO|nr:glycosyltransferase family A protein [Demequina litorisediminis]GMA34588.1 hypothetical protein GCM10025876_07920 [Demequina litorisediminis]